MPNQKDKEPIVTKILRSAGFEEHNIKTKIVLFM